MVITGIVNAVAARSVRGFQLAGVFVAFLIALSMAGQSAYAQSSAPLTSAQEERAGVTSDIRSVDTLDRAKPKTPSGKSAGQGAGVPKAKAAFGKAGPRKAAAGTRGMRTKSSIRKAYSAAAKGRPNGRALSFKRASLKAAPRISAKRRVEPSKGITRSFQRSAKGTQAAGKIPASRAGKATPAYLKKKFGTGAARPASSGTSRLAASTQKAQARLAKRTCSFDGSTQVLTTEGFIRIADISPLQHLVWARDEHTGAAGWKMVADQYSNTYPETVLVTVADPDGDRHTIHTNRIHPFHVSDNKLSALLTPAGLTSQTGGPGRWVEAQDLTAGQLLTSSLGTVSVVLDVEVLEQSLIAYNLTVTDYSTFFVRGADNPNAQPVWVHNECAIDKRPTGNKLTFGKKGLSSDMKKGNWTKAEIQQMSKQRPAGMTRDKRNGRNDPSFVYGTPKRHFIVNSRTGEVYQVSRPRSDGSAFRPDRKILWLNQGKLPN
jgi:hypothetical protein